eukprot:297846-Chlamydomonas_euryale.AAC.25
MLQLQHPPGHGPGCAPATGLASLHDSAASPSRLGAATNAVWGSPTRLRSSSREPRGGGAAAAAAADVGGDEVHMLTAGNRLVALTDGSPRGVDVYVVLPRRIGRIEARDTALKLRAVFQAGPP